MFALLFIAFGALSLLALLTTYLLYPLALQARGWPAACSAPPPAAWPEGAVSILLPVHNPGPQLEAKLQQLLALDHPQLQILLALDGCTDGSQALAEQLAAHDSRLQVVSLPQQAGKAVALNALFPKATGQLWVFTDVHARFDAPALKALLATFADERVGLATARLAQGPPGTTADGRYAQWESRLKWAEGQRLGQTMGAHGPLYALRNTILHRLPTHRLLPDDLYITLEALRAGKRSVLVANAVCYLPSATTPAADWHRKQRIALASHQLLADMARHARRYSAGIWRTFILHKALRWLSPLWLLGTLGGALALFDDWAGFGIFLLFCTGMLVYSSRLHWPRGNEPVLLQLAAQFIRWMFALGIGLWRALGPRVTQTTWPPTPRAAANTKST